MEAPCRQGRALIRLARGNFAGALEDSERGLALAESGGGDPQMLLPALATAALCGLEMGDEDRAASLADRLGDMGRSDLLAHWWFLEFAFVLVGLGRSAEVGLARAGFPTPTRWLDVATSYAAGDMSAAAETLSAMGARPFEAYVRLRGRRGARGRRSSVGGAGRASESARVLAGRGGEHVCASRRGAASRLRVAPRRVRPLSWRLCSQESFVSSGGSRA